jgi:hypothetical protein
MMKVMGLLKFCSTPDYAADLVRGNLFLNTTEFYRHSDIEGVGDPNESAMMTYRKSRGDLQATMWLNGVEQTGLETLTACNDGRSEGYLSCWMILPIPETKSEWESLIEDINRVMAEMGRSFVFLPIDSLDAFIVELESKSGSLERGPVAYSDEMLKQGTFCKGDLLQYQREFRFFVDSCESGSREPKSLTLDLTNLELHCFPDGSILTLEDNGQEFLSISGNEGAKYLL